MRLRTFLVGLLVLAVAGAGTGWLLWNGAKKQFYGPGPSAEAAYFLVERGDSVARVAGNLARQGLITDPRIFRYGARLTEQGARLKFGNYEIPARSSMDGILEIITDSGASTYRYVVTLSISADRGVTRLAERQPGSGSTSEIVSFGTDEPVPGDYTSIAGSTEAISYQVAVPEGLTSWQIVEALNAAEFLSGTVEDLPAEGTLAPDTYGVRRGFPVSDLVGRMAAAQQSILDEEWSRRAEGLPVSTKQEALILASIVEKETGVAEEREIVASVFTNRLNRPMRLQTDPSVMYGVTGGKRPLGRGLRQSELQRVTPYNTYTNDGLPPTPICNPGRDAIRAALNPAETDYLFFVADGTGGHAFAVTYDEHRKNVREWRQVESGRN